MSLDTVQVLQLPPTFDLSMKQKATASMTARLASERPRLLPGGDPLAPMTFTWQQCSTAGSPSQCLACIRSCCGSLLGVLASNRH